MTDRTTSGPSRRQSSVGSSAPPRWTAGRRAYSSSDSLTHTLAADLTQALVALWVEYAGVAPRDARTRIDGNTVTCVLVAEGASDPDDVKARTLGRADYKLKAVSEVTRVTHQRVTSFSSSHDAVTDVATETFTLEPSLRQGASRGSATTRAR
jgi:hypothetical protein